MRRSLLFAIPSLVVMSGFILLAQGEKRISVSQLEQTVAELKSTADTDAARRLAELQLTERLSPQRFTTLTQLMSGEKSRQALRALADQSEFLNPPTSEIPPSPPPLPEQRRIMGLVAAYVKNSIPKLPNFFATRTTDHFEDTPQLQRAAQFFIPYEPLHFLARSQASVFYQGGREVVDTGSATGKSKPSSAGLTTWGVFGPVLGSVLVDAATSKLAWSHWEKGTTGSVAVFDFHVPQEKSHYEVNYCCVATEGATAVADVTPSAESFLITAP